MDSDPTREKISTTEQLVSKVWNYVHAQRDKLNLDISWMKDDSLEDIDSLPEPEVLAAEIVENLAAALENFRAVSAELSSGEQA